MADSGRQHGMMNRSQTRKGGLRTILFALIVAALLSATYLATAAEMWVSIDVVNEDVVAADNQWTTIDVRMSSATAVAFNVIDGDGGTIFEWVHTIDGDYRFEWRGRTTNGVAVASGKYTLAVIGGGLDEVISVKVKNKPKRDDGSAPEAPDSLSITADTANHLMWLKSASGDMVSYNIYSAPDPDGPWTLEATRAPEDVDLTPSTPGIVWYGIAAVDLYGNEGPMSPPTSSDHVRMSLIVDGDGGVLEPTTGTIRLEIPAGALEAPIEFTIEQVPSPPEPNVNRVMVTRGFEVTPHGTSFDPPAILTLRYDIPGEHALPSGYPEDTTFVQYWDQNRWRTVPDGAADRTSQTITVPLDHLSLYQGASYISPHGAYDLESYLYQCGECHSVHNSPSSTYLYERPTQKETCYQCHGDNDGPEGVPDGEPDGANTDIQGAFGEAVIGTSTRASFHPVPEATDGFNMVCGDCHTPHKLQADYTKLLRVWVGPGDKDWAYSPNGTPIGNDYCYECHGTSSTLPDPLGDQTSFEGGVHQLLGGDPVSGSKIQCVLCHDPHASDDPYLSSQEDTCYECHNAATPNTNTDQPFTNSQIEYAFTAGTNTYGATVRVYHHPISDDDQAGQNRQVECASCHNSHLVDQGYADGSKISDPGNTANPWPVTWTETTYRTRGDVNTFCVECHFTTGTGPETAPFSVGAGIPYDVLLTDDGSHERFDPEDYADSNHGGLAPLGNLACTACHDAHGSSNAYMLREWVVSDGNAVDNGDKNPGRPLGTVSGPITGYTDIYDATQYGIIESFCTGCHSDAFHGTKSDVCTACHYHGASKF